MATYDHDTDEWTYDKLDPQVKKEWLAALRSGDYLQANGYLKVLQNRQRKVHYCCLGVVADICKAPFVELPEKNAQVDTNVRQLWGQGNAVNTGALSPGFMKSISLDDQAADELASMNDNGNSFKQIAKWIEKEL